jgi:hypothetical protein
LAGRARAEAQARWRRLGGELVRVLSAVAVQRETVDHERVAEQVEVLAGVPDAVCSADPEGVFDVAVDRFGVVAAWVERAKSGSEGGMGRTFSGRSKRR